MEGSRQSPSRESGTSREAVYDPVKGFCLHTLVQMLRGSEKAKHQKVITDAVKHACEGETETHTIGEMRIDYCQLQCRRDGCKVLSSYWEQTVEGEETYVYSHSKEEIDRRGCIREKQAKSILRRRESEQS